MTALALAVCCAPDAEAGDSAFAVPVVHTAHGPLPAAGVCGTSVDCAPLRNNPCDPCETSHCNPSGGHSHARGSSWAVLRSRLSGKELIRSLYLRRYFLRRYPFRQGASRYYSRAAQPRSRQNRAGQLRSRQNRAGINRHGVTRVDDVFRRGGARVGAAVGPALNQHGTVFLNPISKITPEQRPDASDLLNRGMARFHWGRYKLAAQDFDAVLTAETSAPARYGRLLCAVIRSDWDSAAADLGSLARAGELRADDRLLVAEVFRKANAFPSMLDGIKGYVKYRGGASANLVAAWTLHVTGQTDAAMPYLRRAAAARPNHPAIKALQSMLPSQDRAPIPSVPATPKRTDTPAPAAPRTPTVPGAPISPFQAPLAEHATG